MLQYTVIWTEHILQFICKSKDDDLGARVLHLVESYLPQIKILL